MRAFTDTTGREWQIEVTVGSVKRVRAATDFVLPSIFDGDIEALASFTANYERVVDSLFAICGNQHPEVGPERFAEAMGGDTLRLATEALVRATADFFTSQEQREALHKLVDVLLETTSKITTMSTARAKESLQAVDTDQLAKSCLDFATNGPDKRALTPTTEQQASCT